MGQHLQEIITQFVTGLKNKSEDVRNKSAMDLYRFVVTELREMPSEYHTTFMDKFNHFIFEMVSSSDMNERKGGILAIGMLALIHSNKSNGEKY